MFVMCIPWYTQWLLACSWLACTPSDRSSPPHPEADIFLPDCNGSLPHRAAAPPPCAPPPPPPTLLCPCVLEGPAHPDPGRPQPPLRPPGAGLSEWASWGYGVWNTQGINRYSRGLLSQNFLGKKPSVNMAQFFSGTLRAGTDSLTDHQKLVIRDGYIVLWDGYWI